MSPGAAGLTHAEEVEKPWCDQPEHEACDDHDRPTIHALRAAPGTVVGRYVGELGLRIAVPGSRACGSG